jgi:hypothetical protein
MQLSALAFPLALYMQAPPAPQTAPPVQRWAHQLVLLDDADDFLGAGASSAYRAQVDDVAPLQLSVGPQDPDTHADWWWREEFAGRFAHAPTSDELSSWYVSPPLRSVAGFEQLLLSWNIDCPARTGVCVEIRVRESDEREWTPWLYVGDWGTSLPAPIALEREVSIALEGQSGRHLDSQAGAKCVSADGAKIDVDFFSSERTWSAAQLRLRATASGDQLNRTVTVRRVALCFSRKTDAPAPQFVLPDAARRRLATPFRSQRTERPEIAGRICSPTSIAMLLEHRGLRVDTLAAAERIYDTAHDIYGNWTRAIQGAYSFGAPGYLARFSDWNEVAALIAQGTPIAISIAAKEGELDGAPYPKTSGHLLVLCGFDERGDVFVNDPAAGTPELGQLTYRREQLERVWMARGGTSYVLLAPESK